MTIMPRPWVEPTPPEGGTYRQWLEYRESRKPKDDVPEEADGIMSVRFTDYQRTDRPRAHRRRGPRPDEHTGAAMTETTTRPTRPYQISFNKWQELLFADPDVGQTRLAVALIVGLHAGGMAGFGPASRKTIAEEVGIGERQLSTHTTALVNAGWLRDTGGRLTRRTPEDQR